MCEENNKEKEERDGLKQYYDILEVKLDAPFIEVKSSSSFTSSMS